MGRCRQPVSQGELQAGLVEHVPGRPAAGRLVRRIEARQQLAIGGAEFVARDRHGVSPHLVGHAQLLEKPHDLVVEVDGPRQRIDGGIPVDGDRLQATGRPAGPPAWRPTGPSPTTRTSQSKVALAIQASATQGLSSATQAFDLHLDPVARLEEPAWAHRRADPARRAGEDQVARLQRHRLAEMVDLVGQTLKTRWRVLESCRTSSLTRQRMASACGSGDLVGRGDPRAERRVGVEGLAEHPLRRAVLPGPLGGVVAAAVAEHGAKGVHPGDVPAAVTDHRDELGLVVEVGRDLGNLDRVVGTVRASGRLA